MTKKSHLRLEAERICHLPSMQSADSRTIARRLAKEFKCSIEKARGVVRRVRGASGELHRKQLTNQVSRPQGKAGKRPEMPKSKAEPWSTFEIPGKNIAVLSDIHVPYHDETALSAAVAYSKKRNPDCVVLNGDAMDFYGISRWQKDPRKRNFKQELDTCEELLLWLRDQFPKSEFVFKIGNHEERWQHYLWNNAAELCDHPRMQLENWFDFENKGIHIVDDQRPMLAGNLPILHGHELGRSVFNPVNPARGAFLRTQHTVLVGHNHQTSGHADTNLWHEETFVWSVGCLADLTPEYMRVNRHNHGFAFVQVAEDGSFDVDNMRISRDGKVRS